MVVYLEQLGQARLTNVQTNQYNLLAKQSERYCKVGSDERFTFTRDGRGERNHLLTFFQHKLNVGTHRAEYFFHLVVLVLVNHDVGFCLSRFACNSHVGDNGQTGEASHIFVSFNFISEESNEE